MTRQLYTISTPYSLAEVQSILDQRATEEKQKPSKGQKRQRKVTLKWKNQQEFSLQVNFHSHFDGPFVDAGPTHLSVTVGKRVEIACSDLFHGKILPDSAGGSVITGSFHLAKWSLFIMIIAVLVLAYLAVAGLINMLHTTVWAEKLLALPVIYLFLHWAKEFHRAYWVNELSPSNQGVLWLLEQWTEGHCSEV